MEPATLVDLDRYPLLDLASPGGRAAVEHARAGLAATGAAELEGFLTDEGLAACLDDAVSLESLAYASEGWGTCYLDHVAQLWPEGHPRRWVGPFGVGVVAYDQFPASSPIRALYEWPPLKAFLEEVLGRGALYPYADPLGALNLAVMTDSDQLQWHFDMTDFVVSLALRPAEQGGDFEVVPRIRSADDERYDDVAEVLEGRSAAVEVLPLHPGTLLLFEGRHSVHRVSPIHGDTARLVALLAYDTKPGTRGSEGLSLSRYGRLP